MQPEYRPRLGSSPGIELPEPSFLFDPAKHLLDPLYGVDGLGVALMASSAAINRRTTASLDVLSHMGRDAVDA